jgi:O-antigen/teichoic acid export membrane protein
MINIYSEFCSSISQNKEKLLQMSRSKFARDASLLMILNLVSRVFGFIGSTYAARCLGPVNLGTSALIQATAQQTSLAYEGGFGVVGVRKVASNKANSRAVIEAINSFQLLMALIATALWLFVVYLVVPEYQRFAWTLGASGLIFFATNITYVFQGLEKLPTQTAIATICSLLSAGSFLVFFKPGMFLGADLIVISIVGLIGTVLAWGAYFRIFGSLPIARLNWQLVFELLRESWRYWISSILICSFDLLQIPIIMYFLGAHDAGVYRAAIMLVMVPELLFGSINALLLAKLVAWRTQGLRVMWQKQSKLVLLYVLLGGSVVGILVLLMPLATKFLLGTAYQDSVGVFNILALSRLGIFLGQIYVYGVIAAGLDKAFQWITIIAVVVSLPLMVLLTKSFGLIGMPIALLICQTLGHLLCFLVLRKQVLIAAS